MCRPFHRLHALFITFKRRPGIPDVHLGQQHCGSLFTTCVRSNQVSTIQHKLTVLFPSSDPQSSQVLAKDDVVKIHIGAHIDGFASISAETIVVGATPENPVTGRRADVIKAAWHAAELALRTVKVGNKNWAVTEIVGRTVAAWDCKPVEGGFR